MQALILEQTRNLAIRDITIDEPLGNQDVRIAIRNVGICGSDVHYFKHGRIGPFVVREPMVLGHEASGQVLEVGAEVQHLKPGDRVCMEPGIPDLCSRASLEGHYNLDPSVRFWATPPVHGCLRPQVVHPANFCFKLADSVSYSEGALVEPLATGMQAAEKARIRPGDTAVVIGAGTIGIMTALAALAGGCSRVVIADLVPEKLAIAGGYNGIIPVNVAQQSLTEVISNLTDQWGAQIVFEASGNPKAYDELFKLLCPGGCVTLVGMPLQKVPLDIVSMQAKELRFESVFRYANQFPRALALMASGKLNLEPLISAVFPFKQGVDAFERAARAEPNDVKIQICFE
ncbi:NAD(P)-dependent alcohol dehydrogenase [Motiliproteus sp. MSK22-1]|uniref:NAD(P)-dependent alcohol dehydrogenase n=1 Tax=Motiliproteus sp. MSK22-1 TaxID=1897630 RepID=UPI0009778417|nr:NAD(P)-dependent alcohol dehydrogenase [Motiliproteus sp. MSK22-1]OMH38265.1 sulfurtransferase [Motiliproteus sp. MSK22-1]